MCRTHIHTAICSKHTSGLKLINLHNCSPYENKELCLFSTEVTIDSVFVILCSTKVSRLLNVILKPTGNTEYLVY